MGHFDTLGSTASRSPTGSVTDRSELVYP